MDLYFLRHGQADWPDWADDDDKRPLTADGTAKMKAEAKTMARLGLTFDAILSSPLPRARQTADIVAEQLGMKVKDSSLLSPGFGVAALPELLSPFPKADSILLVGHEPDFGFVVSSLIGGGRLVMKKGGLARLAVDRATMQGELIWLLAPKVLTG